ncbi:MAG: O-antigen ligase family protein [Candidatus Latescibacteria bacterium]|nr:O-antigen ligase family protein [Candidatus Latescibacterota bacterium]
MTWCKPKPALFLIIILLPIYQLRFQFFGLPTTYLEIMIIIASVSWFIKKIINNRCPDGGCLKSENLKFSCQPEIKNWKVLILAWLLIGLFAVLISLDKWGALGHWRAYFLEPILFLIIFISLIKEQKDLKFVFYALSFLALFVSGWAIYQKITGQGMASLEAWQYPLTLSLRSTGPFPHSNFLGLILGPLIILFLGQLLFSLKSDFFNFKKLLVVSYWLLVISSSLLAVIFAKSEGAIVSIIVGLVIFFICYLRRRERLIFVISLFLIFIYLFFLSPWQTLVQQKITFQDLSLKLRLNIWQGAWQMIRAHSFGVGLRGYQQLAFQYQDPFSLPGVEGVISNEFHPYPHNLFLTLWVELGSLGLVVFLLIVYHFFKSGFEKLFKNLKFSRLKSGSIFDGKIKNHRIVKKEDILTIALIASMVVILTHGLVDTPYFKNDLAVLFWIIIGLILI